MMNLQYRISEFTRKPAVVVGGVILTGGIIWSAMTDNSPRGDYDVFPRHDESPLADPRPSWTQDRGYLSGGVLDSLARVAGPSDEAPATAPVDKNGDYIAALKGIAQESAKTTKKKRGVVARLQAALSQWGGSGGSSSAGLSMPAASSLVKLNRVGPGRVDGVAASPDYRAAYRNDAKARAGKVRENVRGDGILAAAGEKAVNVFKNLIPGTLKAQGGGGGLSQDSGPVGKPSENPQDPKAPEGKPVDEAKKPEEAKGGAQQGAPSMGSPGAVSPGNGNGNNNGNGNKRKTGVSSRGLSGDTKAEVAYAQKINEGGNSAKAGSTADSPRYDGGIIAGAATTKQEVDEISQYDPSYVDQAASRGENISGAPADSNKSNILERGEVRNLNPLDPDGPVLVVAGGRKKYDEAAAAAREYHKILKESAADLKTQNAKVKDMSTEIVEFRDKLTSRRTELDKMGGEVSTAGTDHQMAQAMPPGEKESAVSAAVNKASTAIGQFGPQKGGDLLGKATKIQGDTQKVQSTTEKLMTDMTTRLTDAESKYQKAITDAGTARGNIQFKMNAVRGDPIYNEGDTSRAKLMFGEVDRAHTDLDPQPLQDTLTQYGLAKKSLLDGVKVLAESFGKEKSK